MKSFAKIVLVFGVAITAISLLLLNANPKDSAESYVNLFNIGIGLVMVIASTTYLAILIKRQKNHQQKITTKRRNK